MNRDIIVIGASAGGIEVLLGLVPDLPADLPAAVFIVVHTRPRSFSALPDLLGSHSALKATHPIHNEAIHRGHIYVAPPDNQLLLRPGFMVVVRGPRENGHRPAIDPLFRSASWAYGTRVIGVVLSGHQDCGTAGMMSIKARGGATVVQSPDTASAPEMPESVMRRVAVDHVVHPRELCGLLRALVAQPAAEQGIMPSEAIQQLEGTEAGAPAELVCPTCHGVLTQASAGDFHHFRCHVGHAYSLESLVQERSEELERALWAAARSLEEGAALSKRVAASAVGAQERRRFAEQARTLSHQADLIRQFLLYGGGASLPDATGK